MLTCNCLTENKLFVWHIYFFENFVLVLSFCKNDPQLLIIKVSNVSLNRAYKQCNEVEVSLNVACLIAVLWNIFWKATVELILT